jgi:hypothetical protein
MKRACSVVTFSMVWSCLDAGSSSQSESFFSAGTIFSGVAMS